MPFYTNTKDKTPLFSQSYLVYKFTCPGCSTSYMVKTEITLFERTEEHAYPRKNKINESAISEHLSTCTHYDLYTLYIGLI